MERGEDLVAMEISGARPPLQDSMRFAYERHSAGDLKKSVEACERILQDDPSFLPAKFLMAQSLIGLEFYDPAILLLEEVVQNEPGKQEAVSLLEKARLEVQRRQDLALSQKKIQNYSILKNLGSGWEGSVYLAQDQKGNRKVIKMFHAHRRKEINAGSVRQILLNFSANLPEKRTGDPLYRISLLYESDQIIGVYYEFERLLKFGKYALSFEKARLGVLGAYLRSQSLLLRHLGCLLTDALPRQFMLTASGAFRLIDYGTAFMTVHELKHNHLHIVALIRLMDRLFNGSSKQFFYETNLNRFTRCLDELEKNAPSAVQKLAGCIRAQKYGLFLDADFFEDASADLPHVLDAVLMMKLIAHSLLSRTPGLSAMNSLIKRM